MANNSITVKEALRMIIGRLNNIRVPVGLTNDIGLPIAQSISDIERCIDAIVDNDEFQEPEETEEDLGDG